MDQLLFAFYLLLTIPIGIVIGKALHRSAPKVIKHLRKPHNWPKIIAITVCVIIALILIDIVTPIWGGQVRFYTKWVECGQRPYQVGDSWEGDARYYEQSPIFTIWKSNHMEYFCTPKEAEMQWYSSNSNSYSYPNLTAKDIELREKNRAGN